MLLKFDCSKIDFLVGFKACLAYLVGQMDYLMTLM